MARQSSPPESPLSSVESEDSFEEDATEPADDLPPPKRLKLVDGSVASPVVAPEPGPDADDALAGLSDMSSDTSGDVPSSPAAVAHARLDEDDFQDQVTECAWEGCQAGDLGNMDRLVEHIHNDHIEGRQKKYTCEWIGCIRKSMPHASGYALKAHMRSHTREKPFYCYLPECDRSFTRSDALAKHMRTVHETEALRPSDPVPRSMQPGPNKSSSSKLKIVIKTPQSHRDDDDATDDADGDGDLAADPFTPLTRDMGFSGDELALPLDRLLALCRRQAQWAEAEGEELRDQCRRVEELYKKEWLEKEVLLDQVVQSELGWHERRRAVLSGAVDVQVPGAKANGAASENGDIVVGEAGIEVAA